MFESEHFTVIVGCRSCAGRELRPILDLGLMPLADGLVKPDERRDLEPRFPLTLVRCDHCSLVQILETVSPQTLFGRDYPYYSSFSDALLEHAREAVEAIVGRTGIDDTSLVVEIASNDGYLLQWFVDKGIPVMGIDPAPGPAAVALAKGIPTVRDFFGPELASTLVNEGHCPDVIIGNNVLAHVPDQNAFVAAIADLLAPDGMVVMEFPYVRDMIDGVEFDTIYHEHHCYFSITAVERLFSHHGLQLMAVEHLDIHGGSVRVFFQRNGRPDHSVADFLRHERHDGLHEHSYYESFADRVDQIRQELTGLIRKLKQEGARVAAYGAAAKGAILLNHCGLDETLIDYVVDRNIHKQGLEMPGVPLPIVGPEHLAAEPPDYLLILAWNFKEEIMTQQGAYASEGGRFIVPLPRPTVC